MSRRGDGCFSLMFKAVSVLLRDRWVVPLHLVAFYATVIVFYVE